MEKTIEEPYIITATGRSIELLNPDPDKIDLVDIGKGLSREARFNGQTFFTYSVAQHSLLVSNIAIELFQQQFWDARGNSDDLQSLQSVANQLPFVALQALLHDAPEAYLKDLTAPLKLALRKLSQDEESVYDILEARFHGAVMMKFGLPIELYDLVKEADKIAAITEKRDITIYDPKNMEKFPDVTPWTEQIQEQSENIIYNSFISAARYAVAEVEKVNKGVYDQQQKSQSSVH